MNTTSDETTLVQKQQTTIPGLGVVAGAVLALCLIGLTESAALEPIVASDKPMLAVQAADRAPVAASEPLPEFADTPQRDVYDDSQVAPSH